MSAHNLLRRKKKQEKKKNKPVVSVSGAYGQYSQIPRESED